MNRTTHAAKTACYHSHFQKIAAVFCIAICTLLASCGKPVNSNDQPVSFWANPKNPTDSDPCTHATAQAIVKSGLPYPNITTHEVIGLSGKLETHNKTVDVWVGATRFVLPAQLVRDNGMYATNHPMRFWGLGGSLPNFYPVGEPGAVVDGMGAMVDIRITCVVDPAYVATWGKGYRTNEQGIAAVEAQYEKNLQQRGKDKWPLAKVSINQRSDLLMTEVLYERGGTYTDGQPMWEATYWPLKGELRGPEGNKTSSIGCEIRHDAEKRYGNRGWRCGSGFRISPEAAVSIDIYVSQIQHMPAIFEQVKQVFVNAKQTSGE